MLTRYCGVLACGVVLELLSLWSLTETMRSLRRVSITKRSNKRIQLTHSQLTFGLERKKARHITAHTECMSVPGFRSDVDRSMVRNLCRPRHGEGRFRRRGTKDVRSQLCATIAETCCPGPLSDADRCNREADYTWRYSSPV